MLSCPAIGCVADELALTESLGRVLSRPSQTVEFCGHDSGDHDYRNNRDHDITRRENEGKKEEEKRNRKKRKREKKKWVGCTITIPGISSVLTGGESTELCHTDQGTTQGKTWRIFLLFPISNRLTGQFAIAWFEPTKLPASTERIHDRDSLRVSCFK